MTARMLRVRSAATMQGSEGVEHRGRAGTARSGGTVRMSQMNNASSASSDRKFGGGFPAQREGGEGGGGG